MLQSVLPFIATYRVGSDPEVHALRVNGRDYDDARRRFFTLFEIRTTHQPVQLVDTELDTETANLDLAMLVAYNAKQRFGNNTESARHVRETLARCQIPLESVIEELQNLDLPV